MSNRLATERLILRPVQKSDAEAITTLINNWDVARMLARVPFPYTLEDARSFLEKADRFPQENGACVFAVTQKTDQVFKGVIGLDPHDTGVFELGYWLGEPYWGQGFASEAARAIVDFAFEVLNIDRLNASHADDNPASGNVLKKVGFEPYGKEPKESVARSELVDSTMVTLPRHKWQSLQAQAS